MKKQIGELTEPINKRPVVLSSTIHPPNTMDVTQVVLPCPLLWMMKVVPLRSSLRMIVQVVPLHPLLYMPWWSILLHLIRQMVVLLILMVNQIPLKMISSLMLILFVQMGKCMVVPLLSSLQLMIALVVPLPPLLCMPKTKQTKEKYEDQRKMAK